MIRCKGNRVAAWINWHGLVQLVEPEITSRIGKDKAKTERWLESKSKQATFYPGDASAFVLSLMTADRFVARIDSEKYKGKTAEFNIKGLKEAAILIKSSCLPEPSPSNSKFTPEEEWLLDLMT